MLTLIILVALVAIGAILMRTWDYDVLGVFMVVIFGILLLLHVVGLSLKSYNYGKLIEERNSFEMTLQYSRENSNQYESAAIAKEVIEFNRKLTVMKYDNKTWLFNQYIDDRIQDVEPIY